MFLPINQRISREPCDSAEGFTLDPAQDIRDGHLRLVGTPSRDINTPHSWATVEWAQETEFNGIPDDTQPAADWDYSGGGNFPFSEFFESERTTVFVVPHSDVMSQAFFLEPSGGGASVAGSLQPNTGAVVECEAKPSPIPLVPEAAPEMGNARDGPRNRRVIKLVGTMDANYITQNSGEHWNTNVDNTTGYTVEIEILQEDGTSELIFDDGTRRLNLLASRTGLFREGAHLLAAPLDHMIRIRVAAKANLFYLMGENGQNYVGTLDTSDASVTKEMILGHTGDTIGTLFVRKVNQVHTGVHLDGELELPWDMPTSEVTSFTPSLLHKRDVAGFVRAVIGSEGPFDQGTLRIQAQYRNTSNPSWTNFSSPLTITDEVEEIDLTTVPVDGDESDEIRFKVMQSADDTDLRAASLDEITVVTGFPTEGLRLIPEYGPTAGGNLVRIISPGTPQFSSGDDVYVDGVQVPGGDVDFVSTSELDVTMPPGTVGRKSVRVETPVTSSFYAERGYYYVESYDRNIDRYVELAAVVGTRSAFRLKNEVPDGEVGLAYLAGEGLESRAHVGVVDLSYLEQGNVVVGAGADDLLTEPVPDTSASPVSYAYTSALETEEVAVAGAAAGWRELGVPAPLYYKHLIGAGRYYVRTEQEVLDRKELRDSILVHHQDGTPVKLEDYAWDIAVASSDFEGDPLPANTYAVVLLTNRKYIPGRTIFVTVPAVDRANDWHLSHGYSEIVNPEPLVLKGATNQGFDTTLETDGRFTLEIRE